MSTTKLETFITTKWTNFTSAVAPRISNLWNPAQWHKFKINYLKLYRSGWSYLPEFNDSYRKGIFSSKSLRSKSEYSNLTVWPKRTGNGKELLSLNIEGGTTFQQITKSPIHFFDFFTSPGNSLSNIPIQSEIRGLSVLIPAQSYTTTLLYTVFRIK